MIEITDADLLLRLTNYEDHFVERKTSGESKDWLKTIVGFANSAPIGFPAVLYIGVRDGGEIEESVNLDSMQKTLGKKLEDAYPPIYYMTKVLVKDGQQFLAVIVPGSEGRPHFAGPSYVRIGSETKVASEQQFDNLIAQRQSKAYEVLKWKGRPIAVAYRDDPKRMLFTPGSVILEDCNQFYLTYSIDGQRTSTSLNNVDLSFEDRWNCIKLEVRR
jgi:predicted HTH transcriptional regulator